ncbi:MAG: biosynthetic-type acetolactate synthase large subunit [Clostridiales bacterium]|nr:biosynthetic-type acetolactate synthase large subunit [Bacillota bacterium]MEE0516294.1 biosynthetic-type acetolactate synthase large subunit [Anaerovoracaceae bacterium]PWL94659.1 MAG: biosynthetic-type acetolactate synthase large subunit [Clostridiales bacterium]
MKMTGAELVMNVLLEHGVDTVFGYPGGTALFLYDELYKYSDKIKHILVAHEQGGAHAADGYARATGKTGVAFSTSGPGATNLVTGIATAYMDSIPTVFITANVGKHLIGRDAFQEICITGVTFPITKHNYFVNDINDLADALRNAFRIANEGRKGPVLVDITKDVTDATIDYTPAEPLPLRKVTSNLSDEKAKKFAEYINKSKKPVIQVGGGVIASESYREVLELAEKADIPMVTTLMGMGAVPSSNEKYFGMLGMHGSYAANKCIAESDLILTLGCRFSDRVALNPDHFGKKAKILQVDIDKSEIGKNVSVTDCIIGDCKEVLDTLIPLVEKADHKEWLAQINEWNSEKPMKVTQSNGKMNPQEIIEYLCDNSDKETIYVTDVGQHQMWAAQYVKQTSPRNFLSSGGLGTMGFGYGAAIGAQIGNPDKRVIHLTGDGSFHMNLNEACTAVSNDLPIITVIFNNQVLGMVYQWQTSFYDKRYSNTVPERKTDFVKLIEAFGGNGFRVNNIDELKEAYEKALKIGGPVWIDCNIALENKVLPMIPNGKTIDDMLFE